MKFRIFPIAAFMLLIIISCSDKIDWIDRPTSEDLISSSSENISSSSEEASSSSSSGEENSSSSEEGNSSSSEIPSSSSDGMCNGQLLLGNQICNNNVVKTQCGDGYYDFNALMNNKCSDDGEIYLTRCGDENADVWYNATLENCGEDYIIRKKCGGGSIWHNPITEECCGTQKYLKDDGKFCYNNSRIGSYCGDRTDIYDPDKYECKAINPNGIYLRTKPKGIDDNYYDAVLIGTQTWITEDLEYHYVINELADTTFKHFDWTSVAVVYPYTFYSSTTDENLIGEYVNRCCSWAVEKEELGYSCSNVAPINSPTYVCQKYHDYYNANLFNNSSNHTVGICPTGFHIPIKEEWLQLKGYLTTYLNERGITANIDNSYGGKYLRDASFYEGEDIFGFKGLPNAYSSEGSGDYYAYFWTASQYSETEAYYFDISMMEGSWHFDKTSERGVRCVMD